ncbi:MAG: hypothetical protein RJA70_4544 [Pseudomonadota bacterium]|jgi:RNA polymerase sigma-70 factor (ECF subfamily)
MALPRLFVVPNPGNPTDLVDRTDDELMTLSQAGSKKAFAVLVAKHARRVFATCARLVNDSRRGEELAQDTWVKVWEQRARYQVGTSFVPWLLTLACNHCRNSLRRTNRGRELEIRDEASDIDATPEQVDALIAEERRRQVRAALTELPAAMQEALLMRYAEELRYDEMTVVLGSSESTLRSRVHHGLKQLRRHLEKQS